MIAEVARERAPVARRVAKGRGGAIARVAGRLWGVPLACALAVAVFAPCLHYGFAMDDFALLEAGRAPLAVGIPAHFVPRAGVHYRPVGQYGFFWAADHLLPFHPLAYHLANLALHLLNVVLVGRLLRRFVADRVATGLATVFFATNAAFFLVLAWVALAGEALPLLFMLAALGCHMNFLAEGGRPGRRVGWWLGTLLFVGLALLGKQVAVALPPALLLYTLLYGRDAGEAGATPGRAAWRPGRGALAASAALLLPLAAYAWFVLRVSGPHEGGPYRLVFSPAAAGTALSYLVRLFDLPRLGTATAAPLPVHAIAGFTAAALVAVAAWRRDRAILFGLGWFALFLAPVVFLPEHMFNYYLYAPGFGAALVLARLGELALAGLREWRLRAVVAATVAVALVVGNGVGVVQEVGHNPTMVQAGEARRALEVLRAEHPTLPDGATVRFVAPAEHVYYMLGYGAAVRLAYPGTALTVAFDEIGPTPAPTGGPVYRYRWTGETIVAVE